MSPLHAPDASAAELLAMHRDWKDRAHRLDVIARDSRARGEFDAADEAMRAALALHAYADRLEQKCAAAAHREQRATRKSAS